MTSPKVRKIYETFQKMGPMSESIRETYREIIDEMIENLSEDELEELSKSTLAKYASKREYQATQDKMDRNKLTGIKKAKSKLKDKLAKEETEIKEETVTYDGTTNDSRNDAKVFTYKDEQGREHYAVTVSNKVPNDIFKKIQKILPKEFDWKK